MIDAVDYVSLPVADLGRAVTFYERVLGIPCACHLVDRWAEFVIGSVRLSLYPREGDDGRGGEIGLRAAQIEVEMERLKSLGVEFRHGIEEFDVRGQTGRLVRFCDPFGNRLELISRK